MANRIELYLADEDATYLNRLAVHLISKHSIFQVHTFTQVAKLEQILQSTPPRIDILAVSETMNIQAVQQAQASVKVLLLEERCHNPPEGYACVNKFQKTENLVAQIVQLFELASGQVELHQQGKDDARLVGVFSPIGGSGKTALSLLLSRAFAQSGARVFYCNMERICSFQRKGETGQSLSNVLLALQTKGSNLGLKVRTNMLQDAQNGIYCFAAPESTLEWNEVDVEAVRRLLNTLVTMGAFDVVVVDLDGELHGDKLKLLALCNHVLTPVTEEASAQRKLQSMKEELNLHAAELSALAGRIVYQLNKTLKTSPTSIAYDAAYASLEQCWTRAPIPPSLLQLAQAWHKE